ncbi:proton-conducting transporter membrane subunit [Thermococcus sp. Bubb.Bath]|uniref:proton-conducting transporter transmembrane domain-containing protein n=1 Tax=Thermococcus sp. Bubb.Bath TaxID=1638242 RepID=UPI001438BBB8|nr:proton-conducting transporter membrane subunit [Thermococcus sp. Bubb.Bath]NJF24519.1 NADH-quinone oxidoreductase subunit E [Thermococcus sp. Bubb.Bath]
MEAAIYLLILPLAASLLALASERLARLITPAFTFATGVLATAMLWKGYTISTQNLYADWYSLIIVNIVSWVYFFASLASLYYTKGIERPFFDLRYYWSFLSLFAFTMLFTALVSNLGWMWIGLEGTTVVSALLILTEGERRNVEGAWRYMIVASAGLGIAFLSVVLAYSTSGTLDFRGLSFTPEDGLLVALLALIGFGTKVGLFPMHSWLPDAHGSAPSPVSAMLSGTLLPTALLVYLRIFRAGNSRVIAEATILFGVLTLIVASLLMASQRFIKRLLAYSSMDMMGVATTGIGLSYYHPSLLRLVFVLLAVHAFSKGALFLTSGSLVRAYGTHEIGGIRGVFRASPGQGLSLVLSALSVTGSPPFATFIAELAILGVSLSISYWWAFFVGTGLLLSFLALNWHSARMAFGDGEGVSLDSGLVPLTMTLVSLGISVYAWYLVLTGGLVA